jgi:bifunctional ADP-heptose synthase (sugar kinase/adenylyltransferase)
MFQGRISRMNGEHTTGSDAQVGDLERLVDFVNHCRDQGKRIVHCHGEYDQLKVADVLHLREARTMGDVLVVTICPDATGSGGEKRTTFPQAMRAELVAAIGVVDFVATVPFAASAEVIRLIRPDVHAKNLTRHQHGVELSAETINDQEATRAAGSQLRFTKSPKKATGYHEAFTPEVNNHLSELRSRFSTAEIIDHVESLREMEVVLLGETILDEYVYCDALGKSGKEPVLAMRHICGERHAGGVLAIANHLANFCGKVTLFTYLGANDSQEDFVRQHLGPKVRPHFIFKQNSPTILKRRFLDNYSRSKLFAVYDLNDDALSESEEAELHEALNRELESTDAVVVSDFGHGLVTDRLVSLLCSDAPFLSVNTQLNAANIGYHTISKYPRVDYISIHEGELRLDSRCRRGDLRGLMSNLCERLTAKQVMVTRGKNGSLLYDAETGFHQSPAFATKIVDRIGAGDAVFSLTSLCAARGVPPEVLNFLGNLAGAQAVSIVGNREAVDHRRMAQAIDNLLNNPVTRAA